MTDNEMLRRESRLLGNQMIGRALDGGTLILAISNDPGLFLIKSIPLWRRVKETIL
jgi:hypothetical protein